MPCGQCRGEGNGKNSVDRLLAKNSSVYCCSCMLTKANRLCRGCLLIKVGHSIVLHFPSSFLFMMDSNTAQSEDRLLGEEETCSSPQQASETESRSSSEVPPLHVCAEAHQQLASLESFILTDPADFAFTDPGELVLTDPADPKTKAEPDCDASPSPTQPYRMWAKQNWLHELLACLTSLLALIGIIVLVRMYDGEPTPQWPRMITINSAVALLTIIVRGSIVFATAEGTYSSKNFNVYD